MKQEMIILEDNIRQSYMSVVWSHKIQEKQADILSESYKHFETIRIICNSLTSAGLISLIITDHLWVKLVSALISFASTAISLFFKSFDVQKSISAHKDTAVELLILRDQYRVLLTKIQMSMYDLDQVVQEYEELNNQLAHVYKDAPNTSNAAVRKASIALKINNDNKFTDDEINKNLPRTLRRQIDS